MNIYRKLCEKPVSIENIIELKEWMETVPLAVAGYDDAIHTRLLDYEVLDFFNYSLSNTDFDIKWDAITWPYKIKCKMEETEALLIEESEKFLKLQQIDEGELQDKIDYLSSVITNLSGQDDINKVHPIAVEVRLAWKGVKEAQEFGILLNQRQKIAMEMRQLIEEFRPLIPIIQAINHPGMKTRHWTQFKEKTGINIIPTPYLTFKQCLDAGVKDQFEVLKEIVDLAGKEFVLEQALTKMQGEWEEANMSVTPYKTTGSYIMKITDEQLQMLDDHIALTQQLTFSPFKGAFEQEIEDWNAKIRIASEVLDEWFECQKSWMYLEPILTSEDIAHQLPIESKRFSTVQRSWRRIMKAAYDNPAILDYCSNKKLFDQFVQNNRILDQVQRGLTDYLEQKRLNFPRLFFLSDDELLEILSQSKYPWAVQPHLKKCFENIYLLDFIDGTHITVMYSGEGECVKLIPDMYATGSVEVWLLKVSLNFFWGYGFFILLVYQDFIFTIL
ncbi:hypothetical protein AAG570_008729 [Ranatra chinensis]|uniref:Dynein heavy chain linker domain-containing protein n=1 Tax=Ranatra chinensis TaxID=642074 RepID=A0ABD0Z4L5_9HEMI